MSRADKACRVSKGTGRLGYGEFGGPALICSDCSYCHGTGEEPESAAAAAERAARPAGIRGLLVLLTILLSVAAAAVLVGCGGGDEIDCESASDRAQYPEQCMCSKPGQCT